MRVIDPDDPAEVLEAAADVIERDGWCQGHLSDTGGRVCLLGAILRAKGRDVHAGPMVWSLDMLALAEKIAARVGIESKTSLATWNDSPGTTQFDVIDALRLTAKDIRNGEAS